MGETLNRWAYDDKDIADVLIIFHERALRRVYDDYLMNLW